LVKKDLNRLSITNHEFKIILYESVIKIVSIILLIYYIDQTCMIV